MRDGFKDIIDEIRAGGNTEKGLQLHQKQKQSVIQD